MKRLLIILAIIIVAAFAADRWWYRGFISGETSSQTNSLGQASTFPAPSASTNREFTGEPPLTNDASTLSPSREDLKRQFAERMSVDPNYMFKIKIQFYGKVVDEAGNPVAGANVGFTWNKLKSDNKFETGSATTTSDQSGLFSLPEEAESNELGVKVSKIGYFTVRADRSTFDYAQPYAYNFIAPNPSSPVVFHLRKKENGVPLITSQNALGKDFSVTIPAAGTPVSVNLLERKSGDGPLQLSQIKPDPTAWKQATEWSFQMAIPDGGFVEYQNEEFPFEAPATGYQPTIEFDFKKDQPDWAEGISKDYYIEFGNPPVYGRLHVETQIDFSGARLTYAINPDGTRNLEPQ